MSRMIGRVVCGLFYLSVGSGVHAATLYAKVSGSGDCSSWANACSLSEAITNANAGDEVWTKSGTYGTIALKNGVKIIGGFAGTETSASQSDPAANETILDGGGDSQVVTSSNDAASTVLRGFTITNGYDSGNDGGGGLVVDNSSAMFVQCVFKNNGAQFFGAAVAVRGTSSPQFINCIFRDNGSDNNTPSDATDDKPMGGGAVYVYSGTPTFTNCLFFDNIAGEGGAFAMIFGSPTLINCTVADNQATLGYGGGLFDPDSASTIRNSILWNNSSARGGDQIYSSASPRTDVTNSDVQGGWTGTGNINADPLFSNPGADDYKTPDTSPCHNAGSNTALPSDVADIDWDLNTFEKIPKDLALAGRKVNFTVDMGAYETPISSE